MAIHLIHEMPNGIVVAYWRVTFVGLSTAAGRTEVKVAGYVSQAARDAGKAHVVEHSYSITDTDMGAAGIWEVTGARVYAALLAMKPPIVLHDLKPYFSEGVSI